jgi:hypothetical protein
MGPRKISCGESIFKTHASTLLGSGRKIQLCGLTCSISWICICVGGRCKQGIGPESISRGDFWCGFSGFTPLKEEFPHPFAICNEHDLTMADVARNCYMLIQISTK